MLEFIQQHPEIAITVVGAICGFIGTIAFVWRNKAVTNNRIRLQASEMEALRTQMSAAEAKNKQEREALEQRQKAELEAETERRYNRMQREVKTLYEKRLDDYHAQITVLENKDIANAKKLDEMLARIEKLAGELTEQKLLLQAEKRAYAELESFNEALQQNNEKLVKREQELMANDAEHKQTITEMKRRLDALAQRISDLEQDNQHKDAQIILLQDQVMTIQKVTDTDENKVVVLPTPEAN